MKVMMTRQIGFYIAIVVLCGLSEKTPAQEGVIRDYGCLYRVEGSCAPRRTTYGYYETHWRNWPFGEQPQARTKRQERTSVSPGSKSLPDAEVPRLKDEASTSPELPHKQEELAPYVPGALPDQIDIDRQTNPFQDDLQTPTNPFQDDLQTPAADTPQDMGPANPFENDLRTPAVEPPANDSGAMRLGPNRFSAAAGLTSNLARDRQMDMRQRRYGRYNPLRGSFGKAKTEVIATNGPHAAQVVALEEVILDAREISAFPSTQADSQNRGPVSNPLRR